MSDDAERLPAILFADVSQSMRLHEELGDLAARTVIDMLLELARGAVTAHGGHVVKHIGDEILAVLPDADAAARAAGDLLCKVEACPPQGKVRLGMHVGLHAGPFIERDADVFGDAVNVASRLTSLAKTGQILTTRETVQGMSRLLQRSTRTLGELDVRGKGGRLEVDEVVWRKDAADETLITSTLRSRLAASIELLLTLGGRQWSVGANARRVAIGRDKSAEIVVRTPEASRQHGVIEYRGGLFFYKDSSLNGSFVLFDDAEESKLLREEIQLRGRGVICFGHSVVETGDRLEFRTEVVKAPAAA